MKENKNNEVIKYILENCNIHLIKNFLRYIPSKDYKKFTSNLKLIYGSTNLKAV